MRILLVGAQGTLGTALQPAFHDQELVAWDQTDIDLSDLSSIAPKVQSVQPQLVINAAAFTDVDRAEQDEPRATAINGSAVGELAAVCAKIGVTLVQLSTDYVFDGRQTNGYDESAEPAPLSAYGRSKYRGEQLLQQRGRDWILVRTSRLFGQARGTSSKLDFVQRMLQQATQSDMLSVVDDEISSPTYAEDLAQAVAALIDSKVRGVVHRTNDGACTWYEFAREIFAQAGVSVKLEPVPASAFPRPAVRPKYSVLRSTKLPPLRHWREAVGDYVRTLKRNDL
ncbi:MAG: dTDP-4-dehydrorhamnose reductase [Candidatus Kerfeldbacteria bacterium]|nr:dTDP-4-dehydrorhamnose reductase [Candidatus Kerfeldbacteria bacterium]